MAQKDIFVAKDQKIQGPISHPELEAKLSSGELSYTDFIWEGGQWLFLANYFADKFKAPTQAPKGAKVQPIKEAESLRKFDKPHFTQEFGISNEAIWFLYREKQKYGPYRFLELVQLLQEKKCEATDFIWKPGFNDWERIKKVPEFGNEILKRLQDVKSFGGVNLDKVFIKRAFPRVPYDTEVILHDDQQVIIGSATTISEGGAFVKVPNPQHKPGDRLKLHFSAAGVSVPFNCIAEVTQVCKTEPTGYCLKFIYLEQEDQKRIKSFVTSEVRAA